MNTSLKKNINKLFLLLSTMIFYIQIEESVNKGLNN